MSFIRLKQRVNSNGNEYLYAYLVKNEWKKRKKKVKQIGNRYMGRVYRIDILRSMCFNDFVGDDNYFEKKEVVEIFKDLILLELWKFGFSRIKNNKWCNGFFTIDLKYKRVNNFCNNNNIFNYIDEQDTTRSDLIISAVTKKVSLMLYFLAFSRNKGSPSVIPKDVPVCRSFSVSIVIATDV